MKILVACEESQAVTKELRRLGHIWKSGEEVMRWWVSDVNEIWGQQLFEGFDLLDV